MLIDEQFVDCVLGSGLSSLNMWLVSDVNDLRTNPSISVANLYLCICARSTASTRWFKYDRDDLCVNKSQFVPVIFEPPCNSKPFCQTENTDVDEYDTCFTNPFALRCCRVVFHSFRGQEIRDLRLWLCGVLLVCRL